jgi:hypothetical protein
MKTPVSAGVGVSGGGDVVLQQPLENAAQIPKRVSTKNLFIFQLVTFGWSFEYLCGYSIFCRKKFATSPARKSE